MGEHDIDGGEGPGDEAGVGAVHLAAHLGVGSLVVEREAVAPLRHGAFHLVEIGRVAVVVDVLAGAPGAVGQRAQAPAETPLGIADGLLHGSLDRLRPEAPDELDQPLLAHVVGRDLALDVEAHQRIPHRVHDPVEKVLAELSLFHQLDRGHPEALLVDVHHPDGEPARVLPPYVRLVPRGARPAEDLALVEERGHRGDVGLVDGAHPGVAADEHVLLADPRILPAPLHDMGDGEGKDVGLDDDVGPHHHHGAVRQRDGDVSHRDDGKNVSGTEDERPKMVGAGGLEPLTSSVSGRRSNQLSYAPICCKFRL